MNYMDDLKKECPDAAEHLSAIPNHMHDAVALWITRGIEPGSFLRAVICNDFAGAVLRADKDNLIALRSWVLFFYDYAPSGCWRSPENFRKWEKQGGLLDMKEGAK